MILLPLIWQCRVREEMKSSPYSLTEWQSYLLRVQECPIPIYNSLQYLQVSLTLSPWSHWYESQSRCVLDSPPQYWWSGWVGHRWPGHTCPAPCSPSQQTQHPQTHTHGHGCPRGWGGRGQPGRLWREIQITKMKLYLWTYLFTLCLLLSLNTYLEMKTYYPEGEDSLVHHNAIGNQQCLIGERPLIGDCLQEVGHLEDTTNRCHSHFTITVLRGGWWHIPWRQWEVLQGEEGGTKRRVIVKVVVRIGWGRMRWG